MSKTIIEATNIHKTYTEGVTTEVLKGVSLKLASASSLAIVGKSGCGKSTLLQIIGGLDKPSSGTVHINGANIHALSAKKSGIWRNRHLGFVYQFHHLLPEFTALENVAMPLLIRKMSPQLARQKAAHYLAKVELEQRLNHKPGQLSGGERQRAAIARALVTEPTAILADEPTGNLDGKTAMSVFALLMSIKQQLKTGIIIVTHDHKLAAQTDSVLKLENGILSN